MVDAKISVTDQVIYKNIITQNITNIDSDQDGNNK